MTEHADLLDEIEDFLQALAQDLTNLHVAASRAQVDPDDREALNGLVGVPGALIERAQAIAARVEKAKQPETAEAPRRRNTKRQ